MLSISDIKTGRIILLDGQPHKVLTHEHSKMGRMGAVLRTKLHNLVTGAMFDKTFQGADKVEEASVTRNSAQFLYSDGDGLTFMNMKTYEQFTLPQEMVGDAIQYLTEGLDVTVFTFNDAPIGIELPVKVALEVTDAPPSIKGNTSSGGDKVVTVATGAKITTPLFVNVGDVILVNTERGEYAGKQ
jgi:elongation factor P